MPPLAYSLLLTTLLQDQAPSPGPLYEDVSAAALPGVRTTCGSPAKDWILEVNGGGVVLGDFDGDRLLDLVVIDGSTLERVEAGQEGFPPRLFLGRGDCTFVPAGEAWSIGGGRFGMGGTAGDVDGDGWLDLVITQWGATRLLWNDGGRGFLERTAEAGLDHDGWGSSAALLDYDRDGRLDLVVVQYLAFGRALVPERGSSGCVWKGYGVMCGPEGLTPLHDRLFRGLGGGRFEEVSEAAGFRPEQAAFGLGAMTLDFDGDGDTDVYVANDSMPNHLWENLGDGRFREQGLSLGCALDGNGREQAGMGIACGDWNGDGRSDLFVTNFSGESNALYASQGAKGFRERSNQANLVGPSLPRLGWGTDMADLDLDGDLDLYVLNGHVYPEADRPGTDTSYAQKDQLFLRGADGRCTEAALYAGPDVVSRAGALGDLDRDGDLDLVALAVEGPVRVLANRASERGLGHWLVVELRGRGGNRQALGARVSARWEGGARGVEIRTAGGYQAAVPAQAHFGLGAATRVSELRVRWPGGAETLVQDLEVDRYLVLEEPER